MDNPMHVNGASYNRNAYENTDGMAMQNESDLYEYDPDSSRNIIKNATGKVKQFMSSAADPGAEEGGPGDGGHSTNQYKRDIIDVLCLQVNQTLIIPKAFYFFFFAAFGSLFPLMAIYFKQMAMSPAQVGLLFGLRPFVEFISAPFWASVGDRWRKGKLILLASLLCWILFALGVGLIKPPVHSCLMHNGSHIFFEKSKDGIISGSPSKTIIRGGQKVINKRDLFAQAFEADSQMFNNQDNQEEEIEQDLSDNRDDYPEEEHNREKRQSGARNYKVVNVTRIVKVKHTTTTTATTTTTTTAKAKSNKASKNKPAAAKTENLDEIEFDLKASPAPPPSPPVKSGKGNKVVNEAIEKTENEIVDDIQNGKNNGKKPSKNKLTPVDSAVEQTVDSLAKQTIDEENDLDTAAAKGSKKTKAPKKTATESPPAETEPAPPSQQPQIDNYFDSSPLDTNKVRNKIVYLNDSALKLVKPSLETSIVYHKDDVQAIFWVFLFFILAGEFFSAPAITLADACTLQYLGPARTDLYGRQRMFGSLGWALAMFSVGLLLDHSKAFTNHPCGKAGPGERNYTVCFAIYSVLMGCALVVATQFKFSYGEDEEIPLKAVTQTIKSKVNKIRGGNHEQFNRKRFVDEQDDDAEFGDDIPTNQPAAVTNNAAEDDQSKKAGFTEIGLDENNRAKYVSLFKLCLTAKHMLFLFIVWFMGIGVGLVFTFLFWHLQDLGGTPSLYGIASVINHMSELMAYLFVHDIIKQFGHIKVFYAGLLGNAIRFLYVALLREPYWILPFELIQGITHALVWATATSYFAQSVPDELRSTAQGVLQGIHFGLGRGCGAVFGGMLVTTFGTKLTFTVYGLLCLFTLFGYIAINFVNKDLAAKQNPSYNPNQFVQDDGNTASYDAVRANNRQQPEVGTAANPMIQDSKYYYQAASSNSDDPSKSSSSKSNFIPMAPHGTPSTNANWMRQFKKN